MKPSSHLCLNLAKRNRMMEVLTSRDFYFYFFNQLQFSLIETVFAVLWLGQMKRHQPSSASKSLGHVKGRKPMYVDVPIKLAERGRGSKHFPRQCFIACKLTKVYNQRKASLSKKKKNGRQRAFIVSTYTASSPVPFLFITAEIVSLSSVSTWDLYCARFVKKQSYD